MPARVLVSVKDPNGNPIQDLPLMLMNFSASGGLTDKNGTVAFDALPHKNSYVYFYNPNVDGYAFKRFTTGKEGSITKVKIVYQTSKSIVSDQIVLDKDFLIDAICNFCSMSISLGDRFSEIYGKLAHYDCFLSHIKDIYQKKLRTVLEKASRKNLGDYIKSKVLKSKFVI
ncbi:MAG: Ig-like domain-containing protein, partial [Nitrososphaerales archaeon]